MAKNPHRKKSLWILVLLLMLLLPIVYISSVIVKNRIEDQKAREEYEKIPKARELDVFISYVGPDGWKKGDGWFLQEINENKRHQIIHFVSPNYNSPKNTGCQLSISKRDVLNPIDHLTVHQNIGWHPFNTSKTTVDGFEAVTFDEDGQYLKKYILVAQNNLIHQEEQKLWQFLFFCGSEKETDLRKDIFATFINSVQFKR